MSKLTQTTLKEKKREVTLIILCSSPLQDLRQSLQQAVQADVTGDMPTVLGRVIAYLIQSWAVREVEPPQLQLGEDPANSHDLRSAPDVQAS